MTMHASYGLPHFSIGNITINKESVNVKCFLELQEKFLKKYANESKNILSNCEFYFLCTAPKYPGLGGTRALRPEYFVNPVKRLHNIVKFYGLPSSSIIEWPHHLEKRYALRSIPIGEVLGKQAKIDESTLQSKVKIVHFEIDLPINGKVFKEYEEEEIHVIGFSHINLKAIMNSNLSIGLDSNLIKYIGMGGNMAAKKILEKDPTTKIMLPSISQTSLYDLDGSVYRGKAVYNDNGAIFSSTPQGKSVIPLKKATAVDTQISAPYLLEGDLQLSGFSEKQESSKPIKNTSVSKLGIKSPLNEIVSEKDFYKPEIIKKHQEKFIKDAITSAYKSPIQNAYSCVKAYQSDTYNYVNFEIDLVKLISQETEYGNLIDIVKKSKQLDGVVNVNNFEFGFSIKNLVEQINLIDVVLVRNQKIKETAAATITGAPKKIALNKSKQVSININSIPQIENLLLQRQNFESSKSTISFESTFAKPGIVSVTISDRDFYRNEHAGEYSYELKFKIGDKLSTYFHRLLQLFDSLMFQLSKDLKIMLSGKAVSLYTDKLFKNNIAPVSFETVDKLVDIYFMALLWSGKKMTKKQYDISRTAIINSVSLGSGGTVTDLEKFRTSLFSARNILASLASKAASKHSKGELYKKSNLKSTNNKDVVFREVVYKIPCISAAIPDQSILMSFGNPTIKVGTQSTSTGPQQGYMQVEPEKFSYKDGRSEKSLMSSKDLFEEDSDNIESKVLALENGIKSEMFGYKVAEHIAKKIQNLSISFAFGLAGVSVIVPGILKGKTKNFKPSPTTAQKDDNTSGVGPVLEESLARASSIQRSGINKLQQQSNSQQEQIALAQSRGNLLTESMKVLNAVTQPESVDFQALTRPGKIDVSKDIVSELFSSRTGIVLVGIKSGKAELEFVPLTQARLKTLKEKEVIIKIKEPFKKEAKKNYIVINDTYKVTVEELKKYLS